MDALDALTTRRTPARLAEPAPPDAVLDRVLEGAAHAPDHGKLRPWRFVLIRGEARRRFGDLMAASLKARAPDTAEAELEREREKPLRAPLIIAVAARVQPEHPKIPAIEQVLSAGCAAQNIQVGLHAAGYGCSWKTGAPAYDPRVKAGLGLAETDQIVGFLYVGTVEAAPPPRPVDPRAYVEIWEAPVTDAARAG